MISMIKGSIWQFHQKNHPFFEQWFITPHYSCISLTQSKTLLKLIRCQQIGKKGESLQVYINIFVDNFFFLYYKHIEQFSKLKTMGNMEPEQLPAQKPLQSSSLATKDDENEFQQKVMTPEYEQHQNPLSNAFQRGILNREIIASNNKLVDTHKLIHSTPLPRPTLLVPKPRISVDDVLMQQNMQKMKKISNKIIDLTTIVPETQCESETLHSSSNEVEQQARNFQPILLKQENLIKIQQTNVYKKYKFQQKIGEGGFGVVFKALQLASNEQRAIKIITLKNYSPFHKKLVLNQISMLLKIDHPNVIKLYQIIEYESKYFIVTEYCDGGTLTHYLNKHKKDIGENMVRNIFKKLVSAVKYLHTKNIIHRDIKLDNIVIKSSPNQDKNDLIIKIIDFGLAIQSSTTVLKSDQIIGTPQYIAPESIIGMHSFKSDIWSCGIILHMMLVGLSPFKAESKSKVYTKIKKEEIQMKTHQWKNISLQAKDLLARMLSKCAINRPSAKEVLSHPWFQMQADVQTPQVLKASQQIAKSLASYEKRNNLISFFETYTCLTKLGPVERQKLIKHFNRIDTNHNGWIELAELRSYLSKNKIIMTDRDIALILRKLDLNQNERIDLNEFICALTNLQKYYEKEYISQIFNLFDHNHDGYIDIHQLKMRLFECHNKEINHIFKAIDKDNDRFISEYEFRQYLMKKKTSRRSSAP